MIITGREMVVEAPHQFESVLKTFLEHYLLLLDIGNQTV